MAFTRAMEEKLLRIIKSTIEQIEDEVIFFGEIKDKDISRSEIDIRYRDCAKIKAKFDSVYEQLLSEMEEGESRNELKEKAKKFKLMYGKLAANVEQLLLTFSPPSSRTFKPPSIELPAFDGSIDKWISFRDMYLSLVHCNNMLDDTQKFHYLKMAMKIPNGQVNIIDNFPFAAQNYEAAWIAIQQRYDDRRKIISYHFNSMLAAKHVVRGQSSELRELIDTFTAHISALKQHKLELSSNKDFSNAIIVHIVTQKLDDGTITEWRKSISEDIATWDELRDFLEKLQRSLDDRQLGTKSVNNSTATKQFRAKAYVASSVKCSVCQDSHFTSLCPKFLAMNVNDRFQYMKSNKLCGNCLSSKHAVAQCGSKHTCKKCNKTHHTLLHFEKQSNTQTNDQQQHSNSVIGSVDIAPFVPYEMTRKVNTCITDQQTFNATSSSQSFFLKRPQLLSTALIYAIGSNGNKFLCRALVDSGSDTNFITKECAQKLNLNFEKYNIAVTGISGNTSTVNHQVSTTIESAYGPYKRKLNFSVLSDITGKLPHTYINKESLEIPTKYVLADPKFNEAANCDMLFSNDVFLDSLLCEKIKLPSGPKMLHTKFGWTIGGEITGEKQKHTTLLSCFTQQNKTKNDSLNIQLEKFFKSEDCEFPSLLLSQEEKYCESIYEKTTFRVDGHNFMVQMPFKTNVYTLGKNHSNAFKTLMWQENRRKKDDEYNSLYVSYMNDYIKSGHMQEIQPQDGEIAHYLPHHGVLKLSSTTTKLRPVFNASSKSETGVTLNNVLCVGPTVQPESFDIMLRFREHKYAISGDITKMYRQVWIHPNQRKFLRILWRSNMLQPIKHYQLNTVTFGTSCAPYLATRTLQQVAIDCKTEYPDASEVIRNAFYVDDLLSGTDSIEQGVKLIKDLRTILSNAGMTLCKISSNNTNITAEVPNECLQNNETNQLVTKMLGIGYETTSDQFHYCFQPMGEAVLTKARILSEIASIYDPIGWIGPVVLKAKLFMKKLWLLEIKWDEIIPQELQNEWVSFRKNLHLINSIRINRHCYIDEHVTLELHGFCDASIEAYGAVIYALSYDAVGNQKMFIICAKSKVAPKNQKTLARLELCSATLLAKLINRVSAIFTKKIGQIILWSDSTIVLNWIAIIPTRLSTFVGNRVAVIQDLTHQYVWRHIRGFDNPADLISRGLMPEDMEYSDSWWNGPTFFCLPKTQWPEPIITVNEKDPDVIQEMKKTFTATKTNELFDFIENRFSNPTKLINTFAYLKRFAHNTKSPAHKYSGQLSVDELKSAETSIIQIIQQTFFSDEWSILQNSQNAISSKSSIVALAPFIGHDRVIRVGGRIRASPEISTNQKHPILLPSCHFTTIIIRQIHNKHLHPGLLTMMSIIRETYWPLRARQVVRKIIHGCMQCFRAKPGNINQYMSDLPLARVQLTPPFTRTAIDYAGFFNIRTSLTKRSSSTKAYIALFKCMCTGAVHIELVSDLTTKAFLAAFDRFVSRRGLSIEVFTDNATYFDGANNELLRIVRDNQNDVEKHCAQQAIKWNFTTPRAPHAGGIYESGIKRLKHHLKRVLGESCYTFEQFTTIITKIEAILNSRPLTPMSDDPTDLRTLTPGHFLTGRPLVAKPERNFQDYKESSLRNWDKLQKKQQQFWSLWYQDYLQTLQTRPLKFRQKFEFNIGDMVLVKDSNLPPLKWLMGRIVQLYPGKDKVVRNVKILTTKGEKDRHVKYLCLLPMEQQLHNAVPESVCTQTKEGHAK